MQRHPHSVAMRNHVVTGPKAQQLPQQQQAPKALRFVTNYGAPHPKRRRIGAACLTCRKRKTACSGERPFCDTCKQNKLECAGYSSEAPPPTSSKRRTPEPTAARAGDRGDADDRGTDSVKRHRESPSLAAAKQPKTKGSLHHQHAAGSRSPRTMPESKLLFKTTETSPRGSLFSGPRNRMPYFRWLGPTAIMPGFKQMVVKVKRQDTSDRGRSSTNGDSMRSPSINNLSASDTRPSASHAATSTAPEPDLRPPLDLPFYDTSPMPPSELITDLAKTFFTHLGCNYPFLQRERFMRDLEEKKVDAILVDAVCALSARFSTHTLLTQFANDAEGKSGPADYGHAFAQRAKNALIDTFPCPTVAAAQAALLLAYNEFGEQKDSGLWMYLGIAIRLAQDLGMHKLEGLKYIGRSGPTPKTVKRQSQRRGSSESMAHQSVTDDADSPNAAAATESAIDEKLTDHDEQIAVERERVDTFWAIFFLDRVVSSGTGRRSTLRDKDIELSFPSDETNAKESRYPAPFPALIRIVHLYGLVADLLNSIKEPSDVNPETPKRLANMERQVTDFYQGLSSRLHFDAENFQHYMKAGEGTNFVLLHFWFHTLIILMHQPTLLKTFEGPMLRLFPNSQQLAMSSAKTIADILSYSQLMDAKASLGNPFTSQPIYIAACAFLKETAEQTASSSGHSRTTSPGRDKEGMSEGTSSTNATPSQPIRRTSIFGLASASTYSPSTKRTSVCGIDSRTSLSKHTLLATVASQHYQLCYKALQSLETYWAGAKYILTILDQKFEGVGDPLLYTTEEAESSMEEPKPEPSFTSPGWRRQHSWGPPIVSTSIENMPSPFWRAKGLNQPPETPHGVDPSKAIGWTLTGTMNSPSTHLAWHYASGNQQGSNLDPRLSSMGQDDINASPRHERHFSNSNQMNPNPVNAHHMTTSDDMAQSQMTNFPVPHAGARPAAGGGPMAMGPNYASAPDPHAMAMQYPQQHHQHLASRAYDSTRDPAQPVETASPPMGQPYNSAPLGYLPGQGLAQMNFFPGDMMIESQDVDMSMLGLDMMPWFDSYPSHDMMGLFDPGNPDSGVPGDGGGGGGVQPE